MTWSVNIKKVSNGYIVEHLDGDEIPVWIVFEEKEEESELPAMADMLIYIKEHFGVYWNKHHEENLRVDIVKRGEIE